MAEGFTISVLELGAELTREERQTLIDGMLRMLPQGSRFSLHGGAEYIASSERNKRDAGKLAQLRAILREDV